MSVTDQPNTINSPVLPRRSSEKILPRNGIRHLLMRMRRRWQLYALLGTALGLYHRF